MKQELMEQLASRGILIGRRGSQNALEATVAMGQLFGVEITEGREMAHPDMIALLDRVLGISVPEPFYRGFPQSVKALAPDAQLFDQALHYAMTYGLGCFGQAGHSVLEEILPRLTFTERYEPKPFVILTEADAILRALRMAEDMLAATRPLAERDMALLRLVITEYGLAPAAIACRDTAVRLLGDLGDVTFADFLNLSDVIKLADYLNTKKDARADVYHLALSSADRRLIAQVLDRIIAADRCDISICYERKKAFCGLLHHIHYKPKCERGDRFCAAMRGRKNYSVTSAFERAMSAGQITEAARILTEGKGGGALLRNLNYVLSRCTSEEEISAVLTTLPKADPTIYIQLLLQYETASNGGRRSFTFTRHNRLVTHRETEEEATARRSRIPHALAKTVARLLRLQLELLLGGRLGRVYIDPACDRFAVPVSEASTNGGYGVLAKGSRLPIPEGKKLRAFTYWERVNDIDLSAFILNDDGSEEEFSWRTIGRRSGKSTSAVTFSGDETSGYCGGSEFFDIDLDAVRVLYPKGRYIIFCNNVYSNTPFASCVCRAGYMLRDSADSGEIFEPKTVRSAFTINCRSTEAYLFGIDLLTREMVWINAAVDGDRTVAGVTTHEPLERYFRATEILSLGELYRLLATEVVATPEEADVLVLPEMPEGKPTAEVVLPHDFARILSHIAPRK